MTAFSVLRAGTAALALLTATTRAGAQEIVAPPTPNADALAAQVRVLAANPRDISALIAAGELSTRLDDPAAALGFFGRAEAIDPRNPRVLAGKAGALVLLERPGEALRLYDQAERAGAAMEPYLAQRGLAYDLIGQPAHAQRDYRRALLRSNDDETVRRLALSLGISGKRDEAMTLLDPLLRRSDRAAWRARACILAISGDAAGAQRIATGMIPGGAALTPFFGKLRWLSPADRAFAVHFGEVTPSVARANDARLAPALAVLPAEPAPLPSPVAVASSDASPRETPRPSRRSQGERAKVGREPISLAAIPPAPVPAASSDARRDPLPAAPIPPAGSTAAERIVRAASVAPLPLSAPAQAPAAREPVTLASNPIRLTTPWAMTAEAAPSSPSSPPPSSPQPPPAAADAPAGDGPTTSPEGSATPEQPRVREPEPVAAGEGRPIVSDAGRIDSPSIPPPEPSRAGPSTGAAASTAAAVAPPASQPAAIAAPPSPSPASPAGRTPELARRNTEMLASIIETISVPASELGVAPPPPPPPPPPARTAETRPPEPAAGTIEPAVRKPEPATKRAETRKPEPKKAAPDPAKAEPARWWAQVAGGARAADLDKDWTRLAAKSPAAFRGKAAWTTPLRATNRLLAGPFKSQAEAMAFVNALAKDGSSAFAWQSAAGQKIEKLGAR